VVHCSTPTALGSAQRCSGDLRGPDISVISAGRRISSPSGSTPVREHGSDNGSEESGLLSGFVMMNLGLPQPRVTDMAMVGLYFVSTRHLSLISQT